MLDDIIAMCWERSSERRDPRFGLQAGPGHSAAAHSLPVLEMCPLLAFPNLEAAQGHSLETVMQC